MSLLDIITIAILAAVAGMYWIRKRDENEIQ